MEFPLLTKDRRGNTIILEEKDWLHILLRHKEVGDDPERILSHVKDYKEIYLDREGIIRYLHQLDPGHFMVLICELVEGQGYIRTAYIINLKEKKRRYGRSQRLEVY